LWPTAPLLSISEAALGGGAVLFSAARSPGSRAENERAEETMRPLLGALCVFTILAVGWLCAMFLILRHPGFEWRAALCLPIIAQSAATLVALRRAASPMLRAVVAVGAAIVGAFAAWAFVQNGREGNFEGYLAIISAALVLQAILTLGHVLLSRREPATNVR
jgi:hypothetical protein